MPLRDRDIVCFSTHYWDDRRFRKQEFMARFAEANRVLFVEPSFSMARRPDPHLREVASNGVLLPRGESRGPSLHLLKPPRALPKWTNPTVERLTYAWHGAVVAREVRRLRFRDPILWVYRPGYVHALDAIPHAQLVFDLVDDLSAYGGGSDPNVEAGVMELVRRADLLVVTAVTLAERYGAEARRVAHIANGFDADRFAPERTGPVPPELEGLPRPILGFIGTLFPFLDFELLHDVAARHPDKSLVLVGPVESGSTQEVERLVRRPNVHHVGRQPQDAIPAFVAAFDVCLNVFKRSRMSDSVNPLKVYEYLATGRPVVSSAMEALRREDAGRLVAFADGADEFSNQIERCLAKDGPEAAERRRAAVEPYSWQRLFERLSEAAEEALATPPGAEAAAALPGTARERR
ncbi:MAG TPA: glycosyltransferase [Thermoleophilaceae bacterium]|nr:glycosyltransferase [Thermoleophilaceae bacterium]